MGIRDRRLDSVRGILLVIITIDHLGGRLTSYTYEPFGFVSAAAGFVILSGYMYAYTSQKTEPSLLVLMKQSWRRAAKLYRYHLVLLLLLMLLIALSPLHRDYLTRDFHLTSLGLAGATVYGAALLHQPLLMDLLPMYLLFSLLSPPVLLAFHRGYEAFVFTLGIMLWLCGQIVDPHEWLIVTMGTDLRSGGFNLLAWQLLWLIGLYAGFVHGIRKERFSFRAPTCLWISTAAVVCFFLARHHFFSFNAGFQLYFEREDMRALRLVNILCQISVFCYLIRRVPADVGLPYFDLLGRYSLPVFAFHVLVIDVLKPLSWRVDLHLGYLANGLYYLAVIMSLALPAMLYRAYEEQQHHAGGVRSPLDKLHAMGRICMSLRHFRYPIERKERE